MKALFSGLGISLVIVLGLSLAVALGLWWAYALHVLWSWFIVPLGVKAISVAQAYGITLTMTLLLGGKGLINSSVKDKDAWIKELSMYTLAPAISLLIGFILLGFL